MKIQVREQDGVVILAAHGEINYENTALVSEAIRQRLGRSYRFLLDLSNVPYMDSTSLGSVLDTLKAVRNRDGDLGLVGPAENVLRVFELMEVGSLLEIYSTVDEGLAGFAAAATGDRIR